MKNYGAGKKRIVQPALAGNPQESLLLSLSLGALERLRDAHATYRVALNKYEERVKEYQRELERFLAPMNQAMQAMNEIPPLRFEIANRTAELDQRFRLGFVQRFFDSHREVVQFDGAHYTLEALPLIDEIRRLESRHAALKALAPTDFYLLRNGSDPGTRPEAPKAGFSVRLNGRTIRFDLETLKVRSLEATIKRKRADQEQNERLKSRAAKHSKDQREKSKLLRDLTRGMLAQQLKILSVCPYCGQPLDTTCSLADHIYPVAKGGLTTTKNVVFVCRTCNILKRDLMLRQFAARQCLDLEAISRNLDKLGKDF